MRKLGLIMVFLLMSGVLTGNAAIAGDGPRHAVTVAIVGKETVTANAAYKAALSVPQ
jgi:hypothetical protein